MFDFIILNSFSLLDHLLLIHLLLTHLLLTHLLLAGFTFTLAEDGGIDFAHQAFRVPLSMLQSTPHRFRSLVQRACRWNVMQQLTDRVRRTIVRDGAEKWARKDLLGITPNVKSRPMST